MSTVTSLRPGAVGMESAQSILAFTTNPGLTEVIGTALPQAKIRNGDIRSAIQLMSRQESAEAVIVEIGDVEAPEGAVKALRTICKDEVRILAVGPVNDVAFYRGLIAAGADDYLVHPVGNEALIRAVEQLERPRGGMDEPAQNARRIFVAGARGGVGVSSFVAAAGWHLAEKKGLKIAIVDLNLTFGTVALGFDIEPSHAVREMLENPERVDGLFIEGALAQITTNLAVLGAEEDLGLPLVILPGAMELLLEELGKSHDCILIDIPLAEIIAEPRLLTRADRFALVSEMTLTGIRDILRINDFLRKNDLDIETTIIAGKVPARDKTEIPRTEFSRSLSMPVDHILPFDPAAAAQAARNGRAITDIASKSALAHALAGTAEALCNGLLGDVGTTGLWQRLKRKG
jgi:pilus assembly protein CpaE